MAAAMQHTLCGVQKLLWPATSPDLSPIKHVWYMMKRELTLSPEPAKTIAKLQQQVQDTGAFYCRMTFHTFMTVYMREYTGADLEIFDRGGPIEYPHGNIYEIRSY